LKRHVLLLHAVNLKYFAKMGRPYLLLLPIQPYTAFLGGNWELHIICRREIC